MSQFEFSGKRDLKYSKWHRQPNLPHFCHCLNIDFVEVRSGKPKGFFEIHETTIPLEEVTLENTHKGFHCEVLLCLSGMTGLPSFIVYHGEDLKYFRVFDLLLESDDLLTEEEYKKFLITL